MVINKHKLYAVPYLTGIYGYHTIDAESVKCAAKTQVIIAVIFYKTFPNTDLYKKLIPFTPQKSEKGFTISSGYDTLIGEIGKAVTDLRPSGKVKIIGKYYQAMSHGDYIENNEKIIVDGVDENQILVKKV